MDLENHTTKQMYIQLLADTLKKKSEVLKNLMELTEQQEGIIGSDNFNEEQFLQVISRKEEQINILTNLDTGFEKLYDSVKEELATSKYKYESEINEMKVLISLITDQSIKLQAMEKRNRAKAETLFTSKRKEIKNARLSNQTVTNYYKSMAQQQDSQSYFYDKKK